MKQMLCILWRNSVPVENHYFNLPDCGEPRFYQSIVSYTWFRKREGERFRKWYYDPEHASKPLTRARVDYADDLTRCVDNLLPKFEHESIWDLYKAIGYDYKKQRYV